MLIQRHRTTITAICCACAVVGGAGAAIFAGQGEPPKQPTPIVLSEAPERARPPVWSIDVLDAFFDDARAMLVGARPEKARRGGPDSAGNLPVAGAAQSASFAWSSLIEAETIETEVKRLAQAVATDVTTPGAFKGGGYRQCQGHFSQLAVLFGVTSEYDGPIRWQDVAPGLRDAFARAAQASEAGTDQAYAEATSRKQDLEELIRGARPNTAAADRTAKWGGLADRPPLMQRLSAAHEDRLTKWLASAAEFSAHRDEIGHEAQVLAVLAEVIGREGFDYWDEDEYAAAARELRAAAAEAAAAVKLDNYERARRAIDRAGKACTSCHAVYRG
jgi:hypothetical protein